MKKRFISGFSALVILATQTIGFASNDNRNTNKADAVKAIWSAIGNPVVNYIMPYSDVSEDADYAEAVRWAASENILDDRVEMNLEPKKFGTRQEIVEFLYSFAVFSGVDVSAGDRTDISSYTDVALISPKAVPAVKWACGVGIMNGYDDGSLGIKDKVIREQFAAILYRYASIVGYNTSNNGGIVAYNDASSFSEYAVPAIVWASAIGVINGYDDGNFGCKDNITKEQIVTMLYRFGNTLGLNMANDDKSSARIFNDYAKIESYAITPVNWACSSGIIETNVGLTFRPNELMTREALSAILYDYTLAMDVDTTNNEGTSLLMYKDFADIEPKNIPAMQWALNKGIMRVDDEGKINPDEVVSNSELIELVSMVTNHSKLEFELKTNPTTGYSWEITETDESKVTVTKEYIADVVSENIVGSGGKTRFTVTGKSAGDCKLVLSYLRTFEGNSTQKTMEYNLFVTEDNKVIIKTIFELSPTAIK